MTLLSSNRSHTALPTTPCLFRGRQTGDWPDFTKSAPRRACTFFTLKSHPTQAAVTLIFKPISNPVHGCLDTTRLARSRPHRVRNSLQSGWSRHLHNCVHNRFTSADAIFKADPGSVLGVSNPLHRSFTRLSHPIRMFSSHQRGFLKILLLLFF